MRASQRGRRVAAPEAVSASHTCVYRKLRPWHYDAGARHAFQSAKLRRPAMLHYALVSGGLPGVTGRPESDFATSRAHWRNNCTVGPRVLFLSVTTATGG